MSDTTLSTLLSVDQAIAILDSISIDFRTRDLPLQEAQGLYLAEDLATDRAYPPFDKSLMDGFAVRVGDLGVGEAMLSVVGEIAAGKSAERALSAGEAMAIMTGAPVPGGADGVVPVEDTQREGGRVRILKGVTAGKNIARVGSDLAQGEVILRAGTKLEAAQLAAAATVGAAMVKVHPAPRVAVFATGDEVVPFDQTPGEAQIRNSNNLMLVAMLRRMGCKVLDLGIIPDEKSAIRAAIVRGMAMDGLVITGGMSMGAYDFVPKLLMELGVELKITKLRIKPGKPFIYGPAQRERIALREGDPSFLGPREGACHVFGLPGNPVSAFVCAHRLVRRLMTRLAGGTPRDMSQPARLSAALAANGPREFYQPAIVELTADGFVVQPLPWRSSADLFTLASASALIERPENDPARAVGDVVRVHLL